MQKKLLVFLVLLLILPVACMARDFDGFRADVPPGWEVIEEKDACGVGRPTEKPL